MKARIFFVVSLALILLVFSCSKEVKKGKLTIVEQKFSIEKDGSTWVVNVKGRIKNVGEVDVKNIVVTGFCQSCGEILTARVWYKSVYEKEPKQKGVVNYIPVGAEEEFSFKEVAYFFNQDGSKPDNLPDKLECQILSFESMQN